MDPALKTMLTETVTHQAYLGQDGYGMPQYGSPVTVPARVAYRVTTLANAQGQERTSTTVVYMDGDIILTLRDKITLADGSAPAIQNIYSPTDPTQPGIPHHHEISL
jgi:hypothetical protein